MEEEEEEKEEAGDSGDSACGDRAGGAGSANVFDGTSVIGTSPGQRGSTCSSSSSTTRCSHRHMRRGC